MSGPFLRGVRLVGALVLLAVPSITDTSAGEPTAAPDPRAAGATARSETRRSTVSAVRTSTQLPDRFPPGAGAAPELEVDEGDRPLAPADPDAVLGSPPTAPSVLDAPAARGGTAELLFTGEPVTVTQRQPGQPGGVSEIAEPQVATDRDRWLVTWNWYAAQSFDGGRTFRWLNPHDAFPTAFCCDQLAAHLSASDLWVWVRQGQKGEDRTNLLRVSAAQGSEAFDAATFRHLDFTAQDFGYGDSVWLDQPRLGWSDAHLYLTANAYRAISEEENTFVGAAVWRIALADLEAGVEDISWSWFATGGDDPLLDAAEVPLSSLSPVPDAGPTMYLAAHHSTSTLSVWSWPDDSDQLARGLATTVDAAGNRVAYRALRNDDDRFACPVASLTTRDWCREADERITTAWRRGSDVGWAWTIPQDDRHRYPSVWAVEIDPSRLDRCADGACITSWIELSFTDAAAAYPALAANAHGDLGGVVLVGGGTYKPSCYAFARPADAPDTDPWLLLRVVASDMDSSRDRWGDYLGVSTEPGEPTWTGTCMSLHAQEGNGVHVARFAPALPR